MDNGQFQVYTGNGKGKTTAALGLILRASGAGLKVYFGQMMKLGEYSEIKALRRLENVTVEQFGANNGFILDRDPQERELACARAGLERICEVLRSGEYDLVVADEMNTALQSGLITIGEWKDCARQRRPGTELVFTGRGAPQEAVELGDLVTEMREIKHYYREKGLAARSGIEN